MWQILNWWKWFDDDKSKLLKDNALTPSTKTQIATFGSLMM